MTTPAPKHRAIIHLAADMRKGAGAHSVARRPGPSADEWDDDLVLPLKCEHCGGRLGLQDPGTVCGGCKH